MIEFTQYMVTTKGKVVRRETMSEGANALTYYDRACKRANGREVILEVYTEVIEDVQGKDGIWRTKRFKTNVKVLHNNILGSTNYRDVSKE